MKDAINMSTRIKSLFAFSMLLVLVGCSVPETSPAEFTDNPVEQVAPTITPSPLTTSAPTSTSTATTTPTPTPTATPTATSTPSATPTPPMSVQELTDKWNIPLRVAAINFGICSAVLDAAEKRYSEEITGMEAFGYLLAAAVIVRTIDETLTEREPGTDQHTLWAQLQSDLEEIRKIVSSWFDGDITSGDVLETLDCTSMYETFNEVVQTAKADGLSETDMRAILEEIANALEGSFGQER
jgi:hypothetical protein